MTTCKLSSGIVKLETTIIKTRIKTLLQRELDRGIPEVDTPRIKKLYTDECEKRGIKTLSQTALLRTLVRMKNEGAVTVVKKADFVKGAYTKNYWRLVVKE